MGVAVAAGDGVTEGMRGKLGPSAVAVGGSEILDPFVQEENKKENTIIRGRKCFIAKLPFQEIGTASSMRRTLFCGANLLDAFLYFNRLGFSARYDASRLSSFRNSFQ